MPEKTLEELLAELVALIPKDATDPSCTIPVVEVWLRHNGEVKARLIRDVDSGQGIWRQTLESVSAESMREALQQLILYMSEDTTKAPQHEEMLPEQTPDEIFSENAQEIAEGLFASISKKYGTKKVDTDDRPKGGGIVWNINKHFGATDEEASKACKESGKSFDQMIDKLNDKEKRNG